MTPKRNADDSTASLAVNRSGIDNVVSFISVLESLPPEKIALWPDQGKDKDGTPILALEPEYDPKVRAFMRALHDNHFVQPFDWGRWQPTAVKFFNDPKRLSKATLPTCVKLLTLHVRKDRFCGGHFGEMVRCGHIAAILRRLAELRETVKD